MQQVRYGANRLWSFLVLKKKFFPKEKGVKSGKQKITHWAHGVPARC